MGVGKSTPPPANTVAPSISLPGLYEVGQTATVNPGTWLNATSYEYRYYSRAVLIAGASAVTYQLLGADLGGTGPALTATLFGDATGIGPPLTAEVRATGLGGTSAWVATSNSLSCAWSQYSAVIPFIMDERGQTYTGASLDSWASQGSVAATFTAAGAVRPVSGRTINGWVAPDFDGSDDRMVVGSVNTQAIIGTNPTNLYMWQVSEWDEFSAVATVGFRPGWLQNVGSGSFAGLNQQDNAGVFTAQCTLNGGSYVSSTQATAGETGIHVQEAAFSGGEIVGRWDGVNIPAATVASIPAISTIGGALGTQIGATYASSPAAWFNGATAMLLAAVSSTPLTATQLNTIRAMVAGKYNVTTGVEDPSLYITSIAQISSANSFNSATATRPTGSTSMTIAAVCRNRTTANLVREYRIRRWTTATRGWVFYPMLDGVTARAQGVVVNAALANVAEPNTFSPTQNLLQRVVLVLDADVLSVYRNGALMSTGAACVGFTAPTSESFFLQGSAVLNDEFELVSMALANSTAMSAAQVAAWDAVVVAGGSRSFTGATHHYEAEDIVAGVNWTDRIAGNVLSMVGAPLKRIFKRVFE